ncbi:MAG: hypothetical protein P8X68_13565 [Desulfobacterales bacterium]
MRAWRALELLKSASSTAKEPGPAPEDKRPSDRDDGEHEESFEQDMGC